MKNLIFVIIASANLLWGATAVISSNLKETSVYYRLDQWDLHEVNVDGEQFTQLTIGGSNSVLMEKGFPELPYETVTLCLNTTGDVRVAIDSIVYEDIAALPPVPSRGDLFVGQDPETVPLVKGTAYSSDSWYPESAVSTLSPFYIRDTRGVAVRIVPFQYYGAKGSLRVVKEIFFRIIEENGVMSRSASTESSEEFQNVISDRFLNSSSMQSRYSPVYEGEKMVVLTTSKYLADAQPFIDWKKRKGIVVETVLYPDETGTGADAIQNWLQQKYNSDQFTYLTVIGDHQDIPSHIRDYESTAIFGSYDTTCAADPDFSFLSGNDAYPDIFVGRISVNTVEQLTTVINKTINYERYPEAGADWYERAISFGSDEGNPKDYVWMEDSINPVLTGYGYKEILKIYQNVQNGTKADFVPLVEQGGSILNFMGHGGHFYFGFKGGSDYIYTTKNVSEMTNGAKLPFINLVACQTGAFSRNDYAGDPQYDLAPVISEALLRSANGGAIAVTGSSPLMSWRQPQVAMVEMNRLLAAEVHNSIGAYFYNSKMKMTDEYGDEKTAHTWNYLGDPSVQFFTKSPVNLSMAIPATAASGESITITGDEGALVTLYNGDLGIQESQYIIGGAATFVLSLPQDGVLYATVTKRNSVPVEQTIAIGEGSGEVSVLQLTAALGDTSFESGDSVEISWTSAYIDSVTVVVLKGSDTIAVPETVVSTEGSISWTIPESVESGDDYCVVVTGGALSDTSDLFSISGGQVGLREQVATPAHLAVQSVHAHAISLAIPVAGEYEITLYSLNGRVVFQSRKQFSAGFQALDLSTVALSKQLYLVSVVTDKQQILTKLLFQ